MREYKLLEGQFRLDDGTLTIRTHTDIAAAEEEKRAAVEAAKQAKEKKAKENAERQQAHREKMKEAGYKTMYVHPDIKALAKALKPKDQDGNGTEAILTERESLIARAKAAEAECAELRIRLDEARQQVQDLKAGRWHWLRLWPFKRRH
jgi:chromosome segregation ATPase